MGICLAGQAGDVAARVEVAGVPVLAVGHRRRIPAGYPRYRAEQPRDEDFSSPGRQDTNTPTGIIFRAGGPFAGRPKALPRPEGACRLWHHRSVRMCAEMG